MGIHGRKAWLSVVGAALLLMFGSMTRVSTADSTDRPVFSGQATALQGKVLGIAVSPVGDTGYFEADSFGPPTQCLLDEGIAVDRLSANATFLCGSTRGGGDLLRWARRRRPPPQAHDLDRRTRGQGRTGADPVLNERADPQGTSRMPVTPRTFAEVPMG